ncbi:ribosomal protein L7/L12 [Psychrobacillus sp. MER TA 171]|uniref:ribosomal protein L7/L12 n=1 Tax=Psychrobacillus sp. MER TA 171 TaxID=2939577 RepID=UPI00203E7AB2|nr:ribosomal protein L7/L12 [Psychrobacillus sp. MER TA 171]MCM3358701.1 ribosomal protein L7/L12 [Psychrobacillus sp. MER TA 171]
MLYTISSLLIILSLVIYIVSLQSKIKKLEARQTLPFKGDKALEKQIVEMNNNDSSQVEMVKLVRNETGLGLVSAKKYVDKVLNHI